MFLLRDCITRSERDLTPDTSDLMALHLLPWDFGFQILKIHGQWLFR